MGRNPKGRIDDNRDSTAQPCCQNVQLTTMFTVLAGVVQRCHCGVVHRVEHKVVVDAPLASKFVDPQLTFEEFMEDQIRHALEDVEADNWEHEAPQEEDPEAGF